MRAAAQHLNVQVEAALAQGLSFKDKFRTSDRRRERESDADGDAEGGEGTSGGDEEAAGWSRA